jgi:hypothetical protein
MDSKRLVKSSFVRRRLACEICIEEENCFRSLCIIIHWLDNRRCVVVIQTTVIISKIRFLLLVSQLEVGSYTESFHHNKDILPLVKSSSPQELLAYDRYGIYRPSIVPRDFVFGECKRCE